MGFKAKALGIGSNLYTRIQVFEPYEYTCLIDNDINFLDLTPQQATSIVKKSITDYRNGKDVWWHKRNEFVNSDKEDSKFIHCCIEDYAELPIEHAEKPRH